jgi:hypothetical protein
MAHEAGLAVAMPADGMVVVFHLHTRLQLGEVISQTLNLLRSHREVDYRWGRWGQTFNGWKHSCPLADSSLLVILPSRCDRTRLGKAVGQRARTPEWCSTAEAQVDDKIRCSQLHQEKPQVPQ